MQLFLDKTFKLIIFILFKIYKTNLFYFEGELI